MNFKIFPSSAGFAPLKIEKDGSVYILLGFQNYKGFCYYNIPSGKKEKNEGIFQTACRELKEELCNCFYVKRTDYFPFTIAPLNHRCKIFLCRVPPYYNTKNINIKFKKKQNSYIENEFYEFENLKFFKINQKLNTCEDDHYMYNIYDEQNNRHLVHPRVAHIINNIVLTNNNEWKNSPMLKVNY